MGRIPNLSSRKAVRHRTGPPCRAGTPRARQTRELAATIPRTGGRPSRELARTSPSTARPQYFFNLERPFFPCIAFGCDLSEVAYAVGGTSLASWFRTVVLLLHRSRALPCGFWLEVLSRPGTRRHCCLSDLARDAEKLRSTLCGPSESIMLLAGEVPFFLVCVQTLWRIDGACRRRDRLMAAVSHRTLRAACAEIRRLPAPQ